MCEGSEGSPLRPFFLASGRGGTVQSVAGGEGGRTKGHLDVAVQGIANDTNAIVSDQIVLHVQNLQFAVLIVQDFAQLRSAEEE